MSDARTTRLKRLAHRSRYRGFKEVDLHFGQFADRHLAGLDPQIEVLDGDVFAVVFAESRQLDHKVAVVNW